MLLGDCDAVTALLLFVTAIDRVPTAGAGRRRRPKTPPASAATLIHSTARRNDVVLNFCFVVTRTLLLLLTDFPRGRWVLV